MHGPPSAEEHGPLDGKVLNIFVTEVFPADVL
jgi:hypothetical protein